jgi:hypothetical protein
VGLEKSPLFKDMTKVSIMLCYITIIDAGAGISTNVIGSLFALVLFMLIFIIEKNE